MSKRGGWVLAGTALLIAAGAVVTFRRACLLEDRPLLFSSETEGRGAANDRSLDLTAVPPSAAPKEFRTDLRGIFPGAGFQWVVGKRGVARVSLADSPGRTRLSALVAEGGSAYEWSVVLPSSASFESRTGFLSQGAGFRFLVDLVDESGRSHPLFSRTEFLADSISPGASRVFRLLNFFHPSEVGPQRREDGWRPVRVDLSPWAGRSVRISLRVSEIAAPGSTPGVLPRPDPSHGAALWGAPRIWFPAVEKGPRKRGEPRSPTGPRLVLAALETTPEGFGLESYYESDPSRWGDFLRESVSFPRFYTSDVRSAEALKFLLFSQPQPLSTSTALSLLSPWQRVLSESGSLTSAVGAFSEEMMASLDAAGFDEIHQLPHDGYDSRLAAVRAGERSRGPSFVLAYFRDLPRFRWAPLRYGRISIHRFPWTPVRWALWRRSMDSSYITGAIALLGERLDAGSERPLFSAVSLRGGVADLTPVRWSRDGRRGKMFLPEAGWGMRESEIRILFALRQGDRWAPGLCRSPGQLPDVGPTLLKSLGLTVPPGQGRAWNVGEAPLAEESGGRWGVRSPWAKALIVDGRFKYIRHGLPADPRGKGKGVGFRSARIDFPAEEIFDLWTDPNERRNLVRSRRHLLASLREALGEMDPDPVEVRLGFANPNGALLTGAVTCSAGAITDAGGTFPVVRAGTYEFSFSTTASSGTIRFRTWPPASSYSMRFLFDRRPLPPEQIFVSRWGLPLFESARREWNDRTEFEWMDGWAPPGSSTAPAVSLGRITIMGEGETHP